MNWLLILQQAGLPATTASESTENGNTRVNASFSRELSPAEWQLFLSLTNPAEAKRNAAKAEAALADVLANLTPAQAVQYVEDNVTTLASAKTVMKIMVRILVALLNDRFPDIGA
jgi:hypothetical protein